MPVDFSGSIMGTARYAKMLACRFHSELTIAHVFESRTLLFAGETGMPPEWYEETRRASQRLLEACCADEFKDMPVRRLLLDGDVARTIVDLAHNEHFDLIVMPTHGYGGFRRFLLGSITAKLLHDADCPILTGAHMQDAPALVPVSFRNIVCAIDLDSAGEKALRWAGEFAAEFRSHLTVVHALPQMEAGAARYFDQALPATLKKAAEERIYEFQGRAGTDGEVVLERGRVVDVVRDAGATTKADLIVIGRHENPGLLGRLRSNAYAIVRESPCPVVSV
jgi:nucleotide-binding universal stress UspA family protein